MADDIKPESVRGIRCPECGGRMEVANTVRPCRGRIIRYRECRACDVRAKTVEVVVYSKNATDSKGTGAG
jgi:transcriptional regulator NrdR family protein